MRSERGLHLPDGVVGQIGDIDDARRVVDYGAIRLVELCGVAHAVRRAFNAHLAREGTDHTRRGDHPDGVVVRIGDVKVVTAINRNAAGIIEPREIARAVHHALIARRTGKSRHGAIGGDFADVVVIRVSHKDVAPAVHHHGRREIELRRSAIAIIGAGHPAASGDGGDIAARSNFADKVVARIGHDNAAVGRHGNARGEIEPRRRAVAIGGAGVPGVARIKGDRQ